MNRPNLVYVFADQLRYDAIGCNNSEYAITPNIDKLAGESLSLDNCVSGHPVCAPYRASLFTGKYTTSTGMVINEIRMNPNHKCIGHVLSEAGYRTAYLGKWHMYAAQFNNHYSVNNSYIPEGENRLGFDDIFKAYGFHHEYYSPKAYYHDNSKEKIYAKGYEPDFMTDICIDTIKELANKDKPFSVFLSLGTPHDPWNKDNVPKEYYEMFKDMEFSLPKNYLPSNDKYSDMWGKLSKKERLSLLEWLRVYYSMVSNLDYNVGRINATLKELGIEDNTILIFTSDHGEMFGSHGRRAKNIFYNEAVKVPFIVKYKGLKGRNDTVVNTVDIMPTILSMMGLDIPKEVEGEDLSSYILNNESRDCGALLMGTGPVALYGNGYEWRAYKDKQYTYAIYRKDKSEYLFDNINDPYQMINLIDNPDYKEIKDKLKKAMYKKMEEIGDKFESNLYYKRHWIKHRKIMRTATLNNE